MYVTSHDDLPAVYVSHSEHGLVAHHTHATAVYGGYLPHSAVSRATVTAVPIVDDDDDDASVDVIRPESRDGGCPLEARRGQSVRSSDEWTNDNHPFSCEPASFVSSSSLSLFVYTRNVAGFNQRNSGPVGSVPDRRRLHGLGSSDVRPRYVFVRYVSRRP